MTLPLPLLSLLLPLLAIVLVLLASGRVPVRHLTALVVPMLLLGSVAALLPRWGWSPRTPSFDWLGLGLLPSDVAIEWSGGRDLLMTVILLLGAGGVAAYGLQLPPQAKSGTIILLGLLIVVTGSCLTIGATDALVALTGVGVAGIGGLLIELSSLPSDGGATLGEILPLVAGCITLAAATMWDTTLRTSAPVWALGCLLLLLSGPARVGRGHVPLVLRVLALALGVPTLGAWLLVHSMTTSPANWPPLVFVACTLGGTLLLIGGAVWAVTAGRLGDIVAGQWTAQVGLVALALGGRGPALALLIHATWSTVVLGWALAALEQAAGTDQIADLPPFSAPLRRIALVYGIAAGSVLGLPLLAGYQLHAQLLARLPAPLVAVVLATSTLLALAFAPPLAATVRRPAYRGVAFSEEQGSVPALLGALLLVLGDGWGVVRLRLLDPSRAELPQLLAIVVLQVGAALVLLALVSRRLRQSDEQPIFAGGEPLQEEPGWTLPWSGLRHLLRPSGGPRWQAILQSSRQTITGVADAARPLTRMVARRYYLSFVVAVVVAVLLVVASGGGR